MKSVVLEESDPECRIYYVDGCQRKQNETSKNVMELYARLVTEVMENRDDFHTMHFNCIVYFLCRRSSV